VPQVPACNVVTDGGEIAIGGPDGNEISVLLLACISYRP
jgi:hypothetical protein